MTMRQREFALRDIEMSTEEILRLAKQMRDAQKQYWATGSWDSLNAARLLEKQFDKAVISMQLSTASLASATPVCELGHASS